MKVILTGGSGLIGRKLAEKFIGKGYEVIILSRNPEKAKSLVSGAQFVGWDAKSASGWTQHAEGADAIINLAGENLAGTNFFPTRWTPERRQQILQSRLDAGAAVVDVVEATDQKPKLVIQASAIGFYGPRKDEMITEDSHAGNDFLAQVCQKWEQVTAPVEASGVRRVVTRIGMVLTTEGGALTRLLLPYKLFAGGPFGNGKQWYSWIHIDDLVAALIFLTESPDAQGVYNLTAPNPLRNSDFGRALGQVMNRPSYLPVPGFAMKLFFGEVSTVVLDGQRVMPTRLQNLEFSYQFPDVEAAFRDLLNR